MRRAGILGSAFLVALALTAAFAAWTGAARQETDEKIDVLIVTGFDVGAHKWRQTTELTRDVLEKTGRFDVRVREDKGIFESSALRDYDVVVLNYGYWNEPEPSSEGKVGLLEFARSGKGLVSLHFSCSSFQDWDEYSALLGRVWKKGVGGHGPRGKFRVRIADPDHPITKGISGFETDDELYAKLSGGAEIEVLATAFSEWSDKVEPIVFVRRYGDGRVVHNVLGHDMKARKNPSYQKLLIRGVEWAATGEVTVP